MACEYLQVLLLLLWLFVGHSSEVRAQNAGQVNSVPDQLNSNSREGSWDVSYNKPSVSILQSPNGNFIFSLLHTNHASSYCAAVVQHAPSNVTIWVANYLDGDKPGNDVLACSLNFTKDGSLELYYYSNSNSTWQQIWKATDNSLGSANLLQLENTGCLYMRSDAEEELSNAPWKSFDYPTDTLVTGQRLTAGRTMSSTGPNYEFSSGSFHLRLNGSSVILSQNLAFVNGTSWEVPYKTWSGPASGSGSLSSVLMNKTLQAYQRNEAGNAFSSEVLAFQIGPNLTDSFDYARLDSDGGLALRKFSGGSQQIERLIPPPADNCSLPDQCGFFGICSAQFGTCRCPPSSFVESSAIPFTCSSVTTDLDCSMDTVVNVTGQTYVAALSYSETRHTNLMQCKSLCDSCICTNALYVEENATTGACYCNLTTMLTFQEVANGSQTLFWRISASAPGGWSTKSSRRTAASAFAGAAGALVLVLLGGSVWWLLHSRRKLYDEADQGKFDDFGIVGATAAAGAAAASTAVRDSGQLPPKFSYKELKEATNSFNRRLGYGRFSSVCAGQLPDHSKIAVKNLGNDGLHIKEKEFVAAMALMGGVSHPNVVPLRGFCIEGNHRMLVYELVNEGRSLNYFLFRPDSGPIMDAQRRRLIALEMAHGLAHLHEHYHIHGALKPGNVMIDRDMHPQLVDYGLINLTKRRQQLNAANARGSRAYMAPEWVTDSETPVTEKVDVYSFGVVLLELVSGRSCLVLSSGTNVPEEKRFLPMWGFSLLRPGGGADDLLELVDPRLDARALSETDQQVLKGMLFVALWCVQVEPSVRPAMADVVKMLEGDIAVYAPDTPPAEELEALVRNLQESASEQQRQQQQSSSRSPGRSVYSPSSVPIENSELRPSGSPLCSPSSGSSSLESSEHSRPQDHTWLLVKQQY